MSTSIEQLKARAARRRPGASAGNRRPGIRPINLAGAPRCVRDEAGEAWPIRITNAAEVATIHIYEHIGEDWYGEGVSAADVVSFLNANKSKPVEVFINSGGGLVYDGLVIHNALASHPQNVTVTVEGLAYSAASFIAVAGDRMRMFRASDFGIHCAMSGAIGNKREMRAVAEWLETIDEHLVDIYEAKSGQSREQIEQWMEGLSDGTLFSAQKAYDAGFCDQIIDPKAGSRNAARGKVNNSGKRFRSVEAARRRLAGK